VTAAAAAAATAAAAAAAVPAVFVSGNSFTSASLRSALSPECFNTS